MAITPPPHKEQNMNASHGTKKVLFIGQQPETVDFSDPALPPGFDAAKIHAGIAGGMAQMAERGWHADLCLVRPDDSAAIEIQHQLGSFDYDAVVIGGGIRIPPKSLVLFEQIVNAVHRAAPAAAIAFNTTPQDTAEAAARWFK
jgi:hypothetical protein